MRPDVDPNATSLLSQKWFKSSPPFRRTSDSFLTRVDRERLRTPIEQLAPPSKRSFLLLDRFSQSETVYFVSNDVVLKRPEEVSPKPLVVVPVSEMRQLTLQGIQMKGKSIYTIIAEQDREKIRTEIQMAKSWAGAGRDGIEESSFLYVTFTIREPVSRRVEKRSTKSGDI